MTDKTVHQLNLIGTLASDDEVSVWDLSAGQFVRCPVSTLIGATILNGGTLDLGGKSVTVPANGTVSLIDVTQAYTARQQIPALFSGNTGSLADDNAFSFTPAYSQGMLLIWTYSSGGIASQRAALVSFRAAGTPHCLIISQGGTSFEASTSVLAGTTGTDGKVTVSAASDGKVYIENRSSVSMNHGYMIFGGT